MRSDEGEIDTLPDLLKDGLDIVFVGLNPSTISTRLGHYFANPRNRFWKAFNRSGLVAEQLSPDQDHTLLEHGIGFTDVVKRPTSQGSELSSDDFRKWAPVLKGKLERYQPRIVCFHGVTAYRQYLAHGERVKEKPELGLQERTIGKSMVFVVPNPSPANAVYSLDELSHWYRKLKTLRDDVKPGEIDGATGRKQVSTSP